MFERFQSAYSRDVQPSGVAELVPETDNALSFLLARFGGCSFNAGLYRVARLEEASIWEQRLQLAFPSYAGKAICFGYDWLGTVFALDFRQLQGGMPSVVVLEPGTGNVLRIPANIVTFHEKTLIDEHDAALASSFYRSWRECGGVAPNRNQCIGYKKPLFLGGVDDLTNLELVDLDVYWHVTGQLIDQVRHLPPGSQVKSRIE